MNDITTDAKYKHSIEVDVPVAGASQGGTPSGLGDLHYDAGGPHPDEPAPTYKVDPTIKDVYIPPGGEEPPPAFTPYVAESFMSGRTIVSHDPHLNEDGEALYRFLLSESVKNPTYCIHAVGTHSEGRTRTKTVTDSQGHTTTETEHYTETVTDFDFHIDLTDDIAYGPVHWSVPDSEPAYRGQMVLEVDTDQPLIRDPEIAILSRRREATKQEIKATKEAKKIRKEYGLPPWVSPGPEEWFQQHGTAPIEPGAVLRSSKRLREWADEYCASKKVLKEFTYTKIIYGWNNAGLKDAIVAAIRSVYSHDIQVNFVYSQHKIRIRPDNPLSRMLSNMCYKFLLWITLVYPFIWLWKRFSGSGGGRWEVCGGAYAMKTWQQQPPGTIPPLETHGRWRERDGVQYKLVGETEGEWFQHHAEAIRHLVRTRVQSREPVKLPRRMPLGYFPDYVPPLL